MNGNRAMDRFRLLRSTAFWFGVVGVVVGMVGFDGVDLDGIYRKDANLVDCSVNRRSSLELGCEGIAG